MGARAAFTGGHLYIDLTHLEMSAEQQQDLLLAVQTTVVKHLASQSTKVVAISMSPNNGYKPLDEPDTPEPDQPVPDRQPEPDKPSPDPSPQPDVPRRQ
jgi:hypothetical protein